MPKLVAGIIGIVTHHKDYGMAGIVFAPIALLGMIIGAWGLTYLVLKYVFKFMRLDNFSRTYKNYSATVFISFIPPILIGIVTSRAFVTVPVLFLSLMMSYLLARYFAQK
jgi:hypothetical protein